MNIPHEKETTITTTTKEKKHSTKQDRICNYQKFLQNSCDTTVTSDHKEACKTIYEFVKNECSRITNTNKTEVK